MLNSWQHDKACRFTMFGHFIPAKETNQSGFRSLGTSECLSLAKCKWWIAARRFETRRDERKWGGQGVHMFWKLSDIHGPWLHALDDSLGSQTRCIYCLYCIVLFCSLDYSDPKILKVSQSCHLYPPSGTSPSDKSAAVGDFELMKYHTGCLRTRRS